MLIQQIILVWLWTASLGGRTISGRNVMNLLIKHKKNVLLIGRNSGQVTYNKCILYKQGLRLVWGYGIQPWSCVNYWNIQVIQIFQNKALSELRMRLVCSSFATSHQKTFQNHITNEVSRLQNLLDGTKRLGRIKPFELIG